MPPKRKPDRPKKIQPISPEKLRPTAKSPPPPLKPKRGRPPKSQKLAPTARVQKRGKLGAIGKASKPNPFFKAKCILNENKTDYLIEWDVTDPKTGKPYEPSWHPKACANKSLVAAWEADKEGEEWAARGIVDEDKNHYKVAWENNPKTGEVYRDTWEPKAYVGEILVKQWQKRYVALPMRLVSDPVSFHSREMPRIYLRYFHARGIVYRTQSDVLPGSQKSASKPQVLVATRRRPTQTTNLPSRKTTAVTRMLCKNRSHKRCWPHRCPEASMARPITGHDDASDCACQARERNSC